MTTRRTPRCPRSRPPPMACTTTRSCCSRRPRPQVRRSRWPPAKTPEGPSPRRSSNRTPTTSPGIAPLRRRATTRTSRTSGPVAGRTPIKLYSRSVSTGAEKRGSFDEAGSASAPSWLLRRTASSVSHGRSWDRSRAAPASCRTARSCLRRAWVGPRFPSTTAVTRISPFRTSRGPATRSRSRGPISRRGTTAARTTSVLPGSARLETSTTRSGSTRSPRARAEAWASARTRAWPVAAGWWLWAGPTTSAPTRLSVATTGERSIRRSTRAPGPSMGAAWPWPPTGPPRPRQSTPRGAATCAGRTKTSTLTSTPSALQ